MVDRAPCRHEPCTKQATSKGYCPKHYQRLKRYGNPSIKRNPQKPILPRCAVPDCQRSAPSGEYCPRHRERLERTGSVRGSWRRNGEAYSFLTGNTGFRGSECLVWPWTTNKKGYGRLYIGDKKFRAHRLMCEMTHGKPPSDTHQAAHSCGNPSCVNPMHLKWATPKENAQDKYVHGTIRLGSNVAHAKLDESDVHNIRRRISAGEKSYTIAKDYPVSCGAIQSIIRGKSWAWLKTPDLHNE